MRKLLLLALLLYDVVAYATRQNNYDYDDMGLDMAKRHQILDDKRPWRRKAGFSKDRERKDFDERRRADYETRYFDELDTKNSIGDRQRDPELTYTRRRYEDMDKMNNNMAVAMGNGPKSTEMGHAPYQEKEPVFPKEEKKAPLVMNCDRPHERYEACFAGCASVSCDNPRDRLRPCYPFCEPGCVCVHPYVRDDRTHKCVLADDCTKGLKGIPDLGDESS